jgi:RecJ-like exonuclease
MAKLTHKQVEKLESLILWKNLMTLTKPEADQLEKEPCTCVWCDSCNGRGEIPSYGRLDVEECEECNGGGLIEMCDRCQLLDEYNQEEI